jgi:hypothetical protein
MIQDPGVRGNHDWPDAADDQVQARREHQARRLLLDRGADQLTRRPWQQDPVPPSAIDLLHFVLWKSSAPADDTEQAGRELAVAGLRLLAAARAELDQLETGLMFTARGLGLTWAEMARALGLNSPQACQQRLDRLNARTTHSAEDSKT